MQTNQEQRVVLITGASSGIGEATARLLGARGFRLALAARRIDRLEKLAQEIGALGSQAIAIQTDVSQPGDVEAMVKTCLDVYGQLDILVNNAGFGKFGWLENLDTQSEILDQVNTNLVGSILASKAVLPHMISRKSGHIINMASVAGLVATPTYSVYAATKFGLRGFSQALRREVGIFNIQVSVIYPGGVKTEFAEKSGSTRRKTGISTPRFLVLTADDVAESIASVIKKPRHLVVVPWLMRYAVWLNNLVPGLADRIIVRKFVKPERGI